MYVNVYDFDGTVYNGDSTVDFYKYCIKKNPFLLRYIPAQLWCFFLYILGYYDKTAFKEKFYCFFNGINNIDESVKSFWEIHKSKINLWYLSQKKKDDIIISASPRFLLEPICGKLDVRLIASDVCKKTGVYSGVNCYGEEKVKKLFRLYPDVKIKNFYSDSVSDMPLCEISENGFYVHKGNIAPWEDAKKKKSVFITREFIAFLFVGAINVFNGVILSLLFSSVIPAKPAFVLGYIVSLTVSYFLNSVITFKEKPGLTEYVKFCISYIPNFIIQNIIVIVLYDCLNYSKLIAYLFAAILGVPVTFILMKLFVFGKNKKIIEVD